MTYTITSARLARALAAAALIALPSTAQAQGVPIDALRPAVPASSPSALSSPAPTPRPAADRARLPQGSIPDEYRLQPGDKLRVEVYKDAQVSQSVQIRPDGKITLPLIGDVDAQGITPLELRERVTSALRDYMNNPVVTVIVVEGTAPIAYVLGEVNRPGPVTLQNEMTVLQAIALAGGLKDFANQKKIRILRKDDSGTTAIPFNYKDAIKGESSSEIALMPGDTVVVPD
ncbi:MAG: polysaccharide biosynthesis/export family protein [Vicinamibacterales bacterium]